MVTGARGTVLSLNVAILESTLEEEPSTKSALEDSTKDPPGISTSVIDTFRTTGLTTWNEVSVVVGANEIPTKAFLSEPVARPSRGALRVIIRGTDQSADENETD